MSGSFCYSPGALSATRAASLASLGCPTATQTADSSLIHLDFLPCPGTGSVFVSNPIAWKNLCIPSRQLILSWKKRKEFRCSLLQARMFLGRAPAGVLTSPETLCSAVWFSGTFPPLDGDRYYPSTCRKRNALHGSKRALKDMLPQHVRRKTSQYFL